MLVSHVSFQLRHSVKVAQSFDDGKKMYIMVTFMHSTTEPSQENALSSLLNTSIMWYHYPSNLSQRKSIPKRRRPSDSDPATAWA